MCSRYRDNTETQRHIERHKDIEPIIYRSQQCDTRSGLRACKIKGVVTVYNKTIQISLFKVGFILLTLQAPWYASTHFAGVRGISWRVPISVSMGKRINLRAYKPWQKLSDAQDTSENIIIN